MKLYKPILVFMNFVHRQILAIGTLKTVFFIGCCTVFLVFVQIVARIMGVSQEIHQAMYFTIITFIILFFVSVFVHIDHRTKHHEIENLFK